MSIDAILSGIATQGILGALLVLSFIVIYALFKLLISEKDKRREDAQKLTDGLLEPIKQIKDNSETEITLLRTFLDTVKKI